MSLTLPGSSTGQRYLKPQCRSKFTRSMQMVTLKNASDLEVRWSFKNTENEQSPLYNQDEEWILKPKQEMDMPARCMWFVLGDPDLRPGQTNAPTMGTDKTWERELYGLQQRHGAWLFDKSFYNGPGEMPGRVVYDKSSVWEAIRTGLIYCPELVFESGGLKGENYYAGATRLARPQHVSQRDLTPDDPSGVRGSRAPARISSRFMEEDEMIAVRRNAANLTTEGVS